MTVGRPRRPSGVRETFQVLLAMALTFGSVLLATSIADVAYVPGCNSVSNFVAILLFLPTRPSTCSSVPFLSDIPTLILSITVPLAAFGYRLLRRRLGALLDDVVDTGLMTRKTADGLREGARKIGASVDLNWWKRLLLFMFSAVCTVWLYSRNLTDGHLFNTLQTIGPDGSSNAAALRDSWWANYHHHPLLAFLCVFIGTVGVYYGLRNGLMYFRLGAMLVTIISLRSRFRPLEYVPQWRDRSYGWSPVIGILMLLYFSMINFAISMVAVFDMLFNKVWTLLVATLFATFGVLANLTVTLTALIMMLLAHKAVEERLRLKLMDQRGGDNDLSTGEYVVAASDLSTWRVIPVSSFTTTAIKILSGLYALFQFVRAFL